MNLVLPPPGPSRFMVVTGFLGSDVIAPSVCTILLLRYYNANVWQLEGPIPDGKNVGLWSAFDHMYVRVRRCGAGRSLRMIVGSETPGSELCNGCLLLDGSFHVREGGGRATSTGDALYGDAI